MTASTDYRLPKALKTKWLAALRSRKFKQGMGNLFEGNHGTGEGEYCCLGVLGATCKVSLETMNGECFLNERKYTDKIGTNIPIDIQHVLAAFNDGEEPEEGALEYLTARGMKVSGDKKRGFAFIARWIEKYL